MTGRRRIDSATREQVLQALVEVLDVNDGVLPEFVVTQVVEATGRSRATVFRWASAARRMVSGQPPRSSERLTLTPHQREVLAASPNLAKAHADLLHRYPDLGSYWRLWRAVQRLTPGERAAIVGGGPAAMERLEIKIKHRVDEVNSLNVIDHYLMDLLIVPEGTKRVERFWVTSLMDEHTRLIKNADMYAGAPNAVRTVAVIASGVMLHTLDGINIGGLFERLHHDNGRELTGEYKNAFERRLRLFSSANPAYSPGWDGKIEAYHKDVSESFCARFPGMTTGPKRHFDDPLDKQPFVPKKLHQFLTEAEARERFKRWIEDRNRSHRYAELGGRTPLEQWVASPVPLRFPTDEEVLRALLATEVRRIDHRGVQHKSALYRSKALNEKVGRKGLVKYLPNDPSHIWVLVDNRHILAWHEDVIPAEEDDQLLARRRYERRRASELTQDAADLLNERLRLERAHGQVLPLSAVERPRRRKVSNSEELEAFQPEATSPAPVTSEVRPTVAADDDAELKVFEP